MKSKISWCLLAACLVGVTGCSTTRTKIDTGPIAARTFNFIASDGKKAPDFAETKGEVHARIQQAITESLAKRQVARVEQGGDVTVAYLVITGNNAVTSAIGDYFGYGRDSYELLNKAHDAYTGGKQPTHFEAGTLLIDVIDSKTWKVLKRGYASRYLQRDLSPEAQDQRAREVVEEILAGVRFKP